MQLLVQKKQLFSHRKQVLCMLLHDTFEEAGSWDDKRNCFYRKRNCV